MFLHLSVNLFMGGMPYPYPLPRSSTPWKEHGTRQEVTSYPRNHKSRRYASYWNAILFPLFRSDISKYNRDTHRGCHYSTFWAKDPPHRLPHTLLQNTWENIVVMVVKHQRWTWNTLSLKRKRSEKVHCLVCTNKQYQNHGFANILFLHIPKNVRMTCQKTIFNTLFRYLFNFTCTKY